MEKLYNELLDSQEYKDKFWDMIHDHIMFGSSVYVEREFEAGHALRPNQLVKINPAGLVVPAMCECELCKLEK